MKIFFLKRIALRILLRILGDKRLIRAVSNEAVDQWCFDSSDNPGWRSYYQSRHTSLMYDTTRRLLDREKYLVNYGRMLELETLRGAMVKSVAKKAEAGVYKKKARKPAGRKKVKIR